MKPTQRDRGNHPGITDYKGHSYIFGQNYDLMHLNTFVHHERRSVSATEITYLPDGTISEVPYWLDQEPLTQLEWLNPYVRVEAETMSWGKGLKTAKHGIANTGVVADMPYSTGYKNMYVTHFDKGEYIRLRGVDFGTKKPRGIAMDASCDGNCVLTLHLDAVDGPSIGSVHIQSTGGLEKYRTFKAKVSDKVLTGVHDLYIVCDSSRGETRLDCWKFMK